MSFLGSITVFAGEGEVRTDAQSYCFRTVNVSDGLSQNTVFGILQDKTGYMWFGTKDGLNRYDGRSFRIFNKDNSASSRIWRRTATGRSGSGRTEVSINMTL